MMTESPERAGSRGVSSVLLLRDARAGLDRARGADRIFHDPPGGQITQGSARLRHHLGMPCTLSDREDGGH